MQEFRIETDGPVLKSRGRYGAGVAQRPGEATGSQQRMHAFACLGVVVSGRFEYRTPVGATTATPGTIVFGNAREEFMYRYLERSGARRSVIALGDELMMEVAQYCGRDCPTFDIAALPPQRATASLYGLARKVAATDISMEEEVLQVVAAGMSIGRNLRHRHATANEQRRVRDVARYIDRSYASPLRLDDMAAMAQLSKFHFLRAFTWITGESPGRYLVAARLRAAVDRLIDTHDPITAIALDVGFNDISHFNATFRATFGASPRNWRTRAR